MNVDNIFRRKVYRYGPLFKDPYNDQRQVKLAKASFHDVSLLVSDSRVKTPALIQLFLGNFKRR